MGKMLRFRNPRRRVSVAWYLLVLLVAGSGWQYYSIGAITWPTRVAMEIDEQLSLAVGRACALLPDKCQPAESPTIPPSPRRTIQPGGRVVRVIDGDTVDIRRAGETIRVRLLCIDAPERDQPVGNASRKHLAAMLAGETVGLESEGMDQHGRVLGKLYHDGTDTSANWRMIRDGYAWSFARYTCGADYERAEREARAEGLGLWRESDAVPPWEWRRR